MLAIHHASRGSQASAIMNLMCDKDGGGCDSVLRSRWGYFSKQKIPVAFLGAAYYAVLGVWYLVVGRPNRRGRWWHLVPLSINAIGAFYSGTLIYVMVSVLREVCAWCMLTHLINFLMLLLGLSLWPGKRLRPESVARPSGRLGFAGLSTVVAVLLLCLFKAEAVLYRGQAASFREYAERYRRDSELMRYAWSRQEDREIPLRPDDPVRGGEAPEHTVVVFSDFECPHCRQLAEFLDEKIIAPYGDRVRVVFKHFPLEKSCNSHAAFGAHFGACDAARAAEAARALGGNSSFWAVHDRLFASQRTLEVADWAEFGRAFDLDGKAFEERMAQRDIQDRMAADVALAHELGVTGTPSVFIDGKRFVEWQYADTWTAILGPADPSSPAGP